VTNWLFLPCSTRTNSNSLALARVAAGHVPQGARARWFDLATPPLPRFADLRGCGGHVAPEGRLAELAAATLGADELVMVSPIYWYGLAGPVPRPWPGAGRCRGTGPRANLFRHPRRVTRLTRGARWHTSGPSRV